MLKLATLSRVRPPRESARGTRWLSPTRTVTFSLNASDPAYSDAEHDRWVVKTAPVEVLVGGSSAGIRQRATVDVVD